MEEGIVVTYNAYDKGWLTKGICKQMHYCKKSVFVAPLTMGAYAPIHVLAHWHPLALCCRLLLRPLLPLRVTKIHLFMATY